MKTYAQGLEDAAQLADTWAKENFRLASDTVLHDPVLSRRDRSDASFIISEDLRLEGHGYASRAHAAQDIAAAIRALIT